jgi:Ca-activated chloride channel family protein
MTTPAFNSIDDRLTAYAFGELEESLRAEFESQLSNSPELQQELVELRSLAGLLRSELTSETQPTLTRAQHQVLLANAAEPGPAPIIRAIEIRQTRHQRWVLLAPVAAAGLAVAVGIMSYTAPSTPSSDFDSLAANATSDSKSLVSTYNDLYDHQRFTEAEVLAKGWSDAQPQDPTAEALLWKARFARRSAPNDKWYFESNENSGKQLDDVKSFMVTDGAMVSTIEAKSNVSNLHSEGLLPLPTVTLSVTDKGPATLTLPDNRAYFGLPQPEAESRSKFNKQIPQLLTSGTTSLAIIVDGEQKPALTFTAPDYDALESRFHFVEAEAYEAPPENAFLTPSQQPLSTFSIDVDSASYSNVRRFLTQGQRPPADAVRVEEMVNYFSYNYPQPKGDEPFSVTADAAPCPWQPKNYLARIGLQARTIDKAKRPPTNLVFLLDVSGSMQAANKLPLVKQAMTILCEELNERDRIAIVTYAGDAGVKLASTPGSDQTRIMQSIEALQAGGSTNGAAGINLAYEEALRHFNGEGENRVILCTDGDFNVGVSSDDQLVELIQQQAKTKVFLSIFGFGMGNLKDAKLEKLADKGNGHYGYIDDLKEARHVFNEELVGTLYTVAKDVKIQVEFNPLTVGAYRLIGYENRTLAAKDFNDDTKDAGEIGAGHTVTALYEIAPKGQWPITQQVDPLKYGANAKEAAPVETAPKQNLSPESADDLFTVKLRYKQPTADVSVKTIDFVVDDIVGKKITPSPDLVWAASVASFGMRCLRSRSRCQRNRRQRPSPRILGSRPSR